MSIAAAEGRFEDLGLAALQRWLVIWLNIVINTLKDKNAVLFGFGRVTYNISQRKWVMDANFERLFRSIPNPILLSSLVDAALLKSIKLVLTPRLNPETNLLGSASLFISDTSANMADTASFPGDPLWYPLDVGSAV